MTRTLRLFILLTVVLATMLGGVALDTGPAAAQTTAGCARTHVVQPGQNLFRIGLLYGVRWDTLAAWNNLANANLVYSGQVLCVSGPVSGGGTVSPPPASPITVFPGNPFGPTTEPRAYFPKITLGQSFELVGYNFPANRQVTISLAALGDSYQPFYTATTDARGQFYVQVAIPPALQTSRTVAVQVTASGGYFAKNWFYNR